MNPYARRTAARQMDRAFTEMIYAQSGLTMSVNALRESLERVAELFDGEDDDSESLSDDDC